MPEKLFLRLYTGVLLHERPAFDRFWSLLSEPLVGATKWGRYERTTEPFTDDVTEPHRIFQLGKMLFIKGSRDGFLCQLERWRGNLVFINIWWNEKAFEREKARASWLDWVFRLIEAHPTLFGYACPPQEYDAKHVLDTGDTRKTLGVSQAELREFLPGIYWMTVFGSELRHELELERVRDIPGVRLQYLVPDQAVLIFDEAPVLADLDARLATQREIAERLGAEYFFDRGEPDRTLRPIAPFVEALTGLEQGS